MQKHENLVDLVKSFPTNIYLQNLASIQKRTSPISLLIWLKNQRMVRYRTFQLRYSGLATAALVAGWFFEKPRQYIVLHGLWHIFIAGAIFQILPPS